MTTAGHQLDINFLNRLKTIILLSDYTCSNSIGTHTGYCVYLGKPHLVINPVQTLEEVNPLWRDLWETFEKIHHKHKWINDFLPSNIGDLIVLKVGKK